MTQQELFDHLFTVYNAGYWHDFGQTPCSHPKHNKGDTLSCPGRPKREQPEGYGELVKDVVDMKGRTIKAGTTVRVTHASNMGCLDCSSDLNRKIGYEMRLPLEEECLTNCRLTRESIKASSATT